MSSKNIVNSIILFLKGYSLFVLMLYSPINNLSVLLGQFPVFLGWTSTNQRIKNQESAFCESWTHHPSAQSLTLYQLSHCAPLGYTPWTNVYGRWLGYLRLWPCNFIIYTYIPCPVVLATYRYNLWQNEIIQDKINSDESNNLNIHVLVINFMVVSIKLWME